MRVALPYKWTQTLNDVDLTVPVPVGSKSRDLVVEIKKGSIKVGVKGQEPILSGELCKEIKVDDSTWTLGKQLRARQPSGGWSSSRATCVASQTTRVRCLFTSRSSTSKHGGPTS